MAGIVVLYSQIEEKKLIRKTVRVVNSNIFRKPRKISVSEAHVCRHLTCPAFTLDSFAAPLTHCLSLIVPSRAVIV